MKKAYVFPGQGAQFEGMGKDLYEQSPLAREIFDGADRLLGFCLSKIMFEGSAEELQQTRVTQPAMFVYAYAKARMLGAEFRPCAVAGHSLGEFTALAAAGSLSFEDALRLVSIRSSAMQYACEKHPGTMAAILGMEDALVEEICASIDDVVVPANYNSPGQLVISGSLTGIEKAVAALQAAGAKRAIVLKVGGAFHSPLMEEGRRELAEAIEVVPFAAPNCPVYQNVDGLPYTDPNAIRLNLVRQLTAPVRWTQTVQNMLADGAESFVEIGGNVLGGMIKKIDRNAVVEPTT
jgi:[acyl-carrier-protein] S-malonyltransferase